MALELSDDNSGSFQRLGDILDAGIGQNSPVNVQGRADAFARLSLHLPGILRMSSDTSDRRGGTDAADERLPCGQGGDALGELLYGVKSATC